MTKDTQLILFGFFLCFASLGIVISINAEKKIELSLTSETEIVYDNITATQESYSLNLVQQLNQKYVKYTKKIVFTNDLSKYCKWKTCLEFCGEDNQCEGLNDGTGTIYVNWKYGSERARVNLCHESLHFFFKSMDSNSVYDPIHETLIDAAEKGVCYG